MKKILPVGLAIVCLGLLIFTGCTNRQTPTKTSEKPGKQKAANEPDHSHTSGPHGGPIVEWGEEDYHLEFTVDHGKKEAVVYVLGSDVKKAAPITAKQILVSLKNPPVQVVLLASPQDGDPKGLSSRFVGKHDAFANEQEFAGTISGEVDGKPYAGDFKEEAPAHDKKHSKKEDGKSTSMASPREVEVFLKPGGIYTKADVEKNGNTVPSIKFKEVFWSHDDNLKVGDKICPVTVNKADPQCYWWVDDQKYEFCCTPCVEKFVKWAKETPEKVKAPQEYVKKS